MTFIILEGNEKVGKSTVAEFYAQKGFQVVHFSAPPKKYSLPSYAGPSYFDDLIEKIIDLSGRNVLFDRSWWGELVWPQVYGRMPQLSDEDFEVIKEIENQNDVQRVLLFDPNVEEHWKRCVQHKEPVNRYQFDLANNLFHTMAVKNDFAIKTYQELIGVATEKTNRLESPVDKNAVDNGQIEDSEASVQPKGIDNKRLGNSTMTPEQIRLAEANVINDILSKPIVKQKGEHYSSIENKIREFLNNELAVLLGTKQLVSTPELTSDEVKFIKTLMKKMGDKR